MVNNPYFNTEFADSWQQGFVAGYLNPDDSESPPMVLLPDHQAVYSEGLEFGREISGKGIVLPDVPMEDNALDEIAKEAVHVFDVIEIGRTVYEVVWGAAEVSSLGFSAIFLFASTAVFGPDRSIDFDEAAKVSVLNVMHKLQETGFMSENIELYMAACDSQHSKSNKDALTIHGWWHGKLFLNFDQAKVEGLNHNHIENTKILRFQSAMPNVIDIINLIPEGEN